MMVQQMLPGIPQTAHAVLSDDRKYRYVLYRSLDGLEWDAERRADGAPRLTVCFVMLNPSVADESNNDPTIEKLIKYGKLWGFERLSVVNVYALIETDSKQLARIRSLGGDADGPQNFHYLENQISNATKVVCGWGNEGADRVRAMTMLLGPNGIHREAWCFAKNKNGTPVHPLYQRDLAELIPYP